MRTINKSGQSLGRKGHGTRVRVIEATEALLRGSRGIAPSVAAIAREAGISPPTFYLYFADVGEAALATLGRLSERFHSVNALLLDPWPEDRIYELALAFVTAYFGVWQENAALLRARNRLADQGDMRFVVLRIESVREISQALSAKLPTPMLNGQQVSIVDDVAGMLVIALERSATVTVLDLYPDGAIPLDSATRALAFVLAKTMLGAT